MKVLTKNISVILFFIQSFIFSSALAQDSLHIMTLDSCINIAITKSTEVLKGNNNVDLAGTQVLASYGRFLPNLVFGAGYDFTTGNEEITTGVPTLVNGNSTGYNYQLTSSLNIFSGLANKSQLKAALKTKEGAKFSLERATQQISFDVTQSYLQVILDKKIVAYAQDNLNTSLKREDQIKALTDVGRKVKSDLYQQQAQTSSDRLFLINSQNKLRTDKIVLFKKLRIDDAEKYDIADLTINNQPLSPKYDNEQALINEALSQRSDLKSSKLNIDIAEANISRFHGGYLPMLSLNYGLFSQGSYYNHLYIDDVNSLPVPEPTLGSQLSKIYGVIGLSATWNIFDKDYTRSNVEAARINEDNARIDYEDLQIEITTDIKQALGDYKASIQQVETSGKGLTAAQSGFDIINGRYSVGASDFIELQNAQINLLQAQENEAQSEIGLMLQKTIIGFYLGE
jgi:outer membrane protein